MKKIIIAFTLLLSISINAQEFMSASLSFSEDEMVSTETLELKNSNDPNFEEAAEENKIPHRTFSNLSNIYNGYYIIAGVFSEDRNLNKHVKKYTKKGFNAGAIVSPENGLNYLSLDYQSDWKESLSKITSEFNGRYKEEVWIMEVENSLPAIQNPSKEIEEEEELSSNSTSKNIENLSVTTKEKRNTNKSKLIKKADYYFNKMWYAEAADLYEQALKKGEKNYSYEVIQKAADSHYFNTDMEKAYYFYNLLYEKYEKEMSSDNIFKYAHSLKGTGNYARSKRLMRLYNKKIEKENLETLAADQATTNEIVLDNILKSSKNYEIENLSINSIYSEFSPIFHGDNDIVYASAKDSSFFNTRKYKWNDQPYLDLYLAKINNETQALKDAIKFSRKINTKYHEASVAFSPDNKTMYFTRNNYGKKLKRDSKGINHLKIYQAKKVNGEWTEGIELPFNSNSYSTGHPALSPDGKELYFVSDMPGSIGQTDIFMVEVYEDGSFSEPRNLGPEINTEQREMFPFINDKKLYFSSDGHTGLGGLDVYEVTYEEENGFLDVHNLGQPINSNKDDFSYIINEESQKGYFASNREGGKGDDDIYSFENLTPEQAPVVKNAIAGVITELVTDEIMPKAMVQLLDENNIKLKEVESNEDGSFIFEDLDATKKYVIKTIKGTYFDETKEVTTKENGTVNLDVSLRKLDEMIALEDGIKKLKTEMIHFDFDKSYIRNDASEELDKLVKVMTEYPKMVIKIESHTDSRGKKAYNKYLSDKRAKSTRDYIISQGISAERIQSAIGYGEEKLINECNGTVRCTEKKHYLNRRSEFIIVKM